MIIAIGSDLCNIERIQASLDRFGERFELRVFTEVERARAARRPFTRAGTLAKRFAAKEAFTKALGTGIHAPANWHGVWVQNLKSGKPVLEYTPALAALVAARGIKRAHLTITDEREIASATVILECDD